MTRALCMSLALLLALASASHAGTIGYWRMEVDNDASAGGLDVPNEVLGGTSLLSSEATLDGSNLPLGVVPLTSDPNLFSVAATTQGASNGINASASWYAALDVTSITIEYWGRTVENTATPFDFGSATNPNSGVRIANPNSLDVFWHVLDGGTVTSLQMLDLYDMGSAWQHYAFTYDEVDGVATFYVDGGVVGTYDGPDNAPLVIETDGSTSVNLGVLMDYAQAGQGTLDEVRIDDGALFNPSFLLPEPVALLLLSPLLCLMKRRRS